MSYDAAHAVRLKDLKTFGNKINDAVNAKNAGAHNSIYRGKDLGGVITAAQLAAIRNNTFSELYVGDNWEINVGAGKVRALIVGFNLFREIITPGVGPMTKPHAVVLLYPAFMPRPWAFPLNDTNTCEGHFLNSKLYTEHFPEMQAQIESAFGAENLVAIHDGVADSIDANGNINHRTGGLHKVFLPSFHNLTGREYNPNKMSFLFANSVKFPLFNYRTVNDMNMLYCAISDSYDATHWGRIYNQGPILVGIDPSIATAWMPFILLG